MSDRRQRDLELLRRSQQALQEEQARHESGEAVPEQARERRAPAPDQASDGGQVRMYRGKPIRTGGGSTPGSSGGTGRATQFRGQSTDRKKAAPDLKVVLERLNELYKDGLISKSEYDRKRLQILDRL